MCTSARERILTGRDFFLGDLAGKCLALHFHFENMLYYLPRTISSKGGGSEKCIDTATAQAEIRRGPLAVLCVVSPLAIGSNAELELIQPEHLVKNILRDLSVSLGGGGGGSRTASALLPLPLMLLHVIFIFRKRRIRG